MSGEERAPGGGDFRVARAQAAIDARRAADRVRELHETRGFKVKLTRAGESFLLHVTDAGASRWMDLTREEAQELSDDLTTQLSQWLRGEDRCRA